MRMYRIGNRVAKELRCMTHGPEQWWGEGQRGGNQNNYNSIIKYNLTLKVLIKIHISLPSVVQLVGASSHDQNVVNSIPGQTHT